MAIEAEDAIDRYLAPRFAHFLYFLLSTKKQNNLSLTCPFLLPKEKKMAISNRILIIRSLMVCTTLALG
ncbi:unnamed protein product [Brassica rapa subsp. narinosa]